MKGEGKKKRYTFLVDTTPGLLTDAQLKKLPTILQNKHAKLIAACEKDKAELKRKKLPPKNPKPAEKPEKEVYGNSIYPENGEEKVYGNSPYQTVKPSGNSASNITSNTLPTTNIVDELEKLGVRPDQAKKLAEQFTPEHIHQQIEYLKFRLATEPAGSVRGPGGYLASAIRKNNSAPPNFKTEAEREKEAKKKEQARKNRDRTAIEIQRASEARERAANEQKAQQWTSLQERYKTTVKELEIWPKVIDELRSRMAPTQYAHLLESKLLSLGESEAVIGLGNRKAMEWVEGRLKGVVGQVLASHANTQELNLKFDHL